ncbi:MAG: hypothetical protein PUD16_00500 [bacterium]|nr:hypothetical protein [bacterium]
MLRNCLKTLLCVLLVLMLPLCALADVQHSLKVIPGSGMGLDQAVADLMDVISLKLTKGAKSGALTIALEDADIATAAITADATGMYVHSNLLSDDVLYVTWDDGFAYLTEMLKAQLSAEDVPESELAALDTTMSQLKDAVVSAAGSGMMGSAIGAMNIDVSAIAQTLQDDPAMLDFVSSVLEKLTVENGSFTDEARDAADQKYTITLTSEELLKLCDTEYMRALVREVAAMTQTDAQGEDLEKTVDEMLEQVRDIYRSSDYEMVMTMYTQNGGSALAGVEMGMSMAVKENNNASSIAINLNYDRLTDETGVAYKADMAVALDGSSAVQMAFELHRGLDEVSKGSFALLAEGEEITFLYRAENTQPDVRERRVDLYLRSGAAAIIAPAFSDRPVISFDVVSSPADPAVLAKIEQADPYTSVNVMKLSDEEMQALGSGISARCMQAVYSALAKLPTSALQLAMQLMQ